MIRSTTHSLKFSNTSKLLDVNAFLEEGRLAAQEYVDFIWNNKIYQDNKLILDIQNDILNSIKYLDYNLISSKTYLSARTLSSIATQVCGVINGVIKRRSKFLYVANKLLSENKTEDYKKVKKKLDEMKISKPQIGKNFRFELSSKLVDLQFNKTSFNCFIRLKSLGKQYKHIKIPIKLTSQDKKWSKGKILNSILLGNNSIDLRYESKTPELKTEGIIVGADTGVNSVITLSDRQSPTLTDKHGNSLSSILDKLARKRPGSKAFKRGQDHRKNFINFSINQINISNIKQINLEHISNLFYKKNSSKKLKRFTNSLIEEKLKRYLEEAGVQLILKTSVYKSQRCSQCGLVHYLNRKGKVFICRKCGYTEDADYNASINNAIDLPEVPRYIVVQKLNKKLGFYWKEDGLFNLEGQEFRVPDC